MEHRGGIWNSWKKMIKEKRRSLIGWNSVISYRLPFDKMVLDERAFFG